MKKRIITGLLLIALLNILAIPALAASTVVEGGTSPSWSYTATLDGNDAATKTTIQAGDMYVLIVIKSTALNSGGFPTALTADAITYIDQKTADAANATSNTISFTGFIPMSYSGGTAFITGGTLTKPLALGVLASHGVLGDTNGDNKITATDITVIRDHILKRTLMTGTNLAMADVNADGKITAADISKIRDYILKRITTLS